MNRIVFVTRANKESGRGHFYRVLRIIEDLRLDRECVLVCDNEVITEIKNVKFHLFNEDSPKSLISELELVDSDLLWFDIPDSQYDMIESFTGYGFSIISTNMFDKMAVPNRHENIALYPVYEKYKRRLLPNNTIQLSGADFISTASQFFYENEKKMPSVIVSMGGTDPMGFTPLVLEAISKLECSNFTFDIILPQGLDFEECSVKYHSRSYMNIYEFGTLDFAMTLKNAEYAIINGGMTRYECIASKTYFIALSIHNIQKALTEKVTRFGLGENFGVFDETKIDKLTYLLTRLPHEIIFNDASHSPPLLRPNGAKWILNEIIRELNYENK